MRARMSTSASNRSGILYLVSTPIGNVEDITVRALRILKTVDLVAAEDPQQTAKLFQHYGIETTLTSYHNLNKEEKTAILIHRLTEGHSVALVSDTGTPLISDPGSYLVTQAVRHGVRVTPIPGASALLAAVPASGMAAEAIVFHGLLPQRPKARRRAFERMRGDPRLHVLFASAEELCAVLDDMMAMLGHPRITLACNLTMPDEGFIRGTPKQLKARCREKQICGEVTLLVKSARFQPRPRKRGVAHTVSLRRVFGSSHDRTGRKGSG